MHILEAKNQLRPSMYNTKLLQIIFGGIIWLCILIISYFRYILYRYVYGQYKLKELKPIDILILLRALADHVATLCLVVYGTLIFFNDTSLQYIPGGTSYCSVLIYTLEFARSYSFIGNLILSIYRILLIKGYESVTLHISIKNRFRLLLILGISLALLCVVSKASNDYEQLRRDTCHLVLRNQILLVLDEYEQTIGGLSILSYWQSMQLLDKYGRICTKIAELIIYIIFFHHIFKNDNSPGLRRLLAPNIIKHRNRTNAITFFGQFCSFVFELSWTVVYIISTFLAYRSRRLLVFRFAIRMLASTCMPIIEVITSNTLRKRIIKFSFYDVIFGLK